MKRLFLAMLVCAGCSADASPDESIDEQESAVVGPNTSHSAVQTSDTRVSSRCGTMTISMDVVATKVSGRWRITGRTSRNLKSVFSFVPDDPFGQAKLLSPRTFEVTLDAEHEIASMLAGGPLLVRLEPVSGPTTFAKLDFAPRLASFYGDGRIYLSSSVKPIYYVDGISNLRYRGTVSTSGADVRVTTSAGDAIVGSGFFDLTNDEGLAAMGGSLRAEATFSGRVAAKQATLQVALTSLAATIDDPYDAFPPNPCSPQVRSCMVGKTVDFSACGSYRDVQACGGFTP
jgi:hypothetical protein